jgi:hypothetical protein
MEICSSQKASSSEYLEYLSSVWLFDLEYSNPQTNQIVLGLPYSVASTLRQIKSPGRQLSLIVIDHHMKDSLQFLDMNDLYFLLHGIFTHLQGFHARNISSVISAGGRFHTKPQG